MSHTKDRRPETPVAHVNCAANDGPPTADDRRLARALEEYLAAQEAGHKPGRQDFVARHPDIAGPLGECLDGLEFVQAATPQLQPPMPNAPASAAEVAAGTSLGDYRILREVGRGGMGIVFEADQGSLGRRVALKVLPFAAALDARQLQRFKNEAQAAAQLHHQHIVPVYAVGCERGVHYYAMQFIEGQTLAAWIQDRRRLAGRDDREATATGQLPVPTKQADNREDHRPSGETSPSHPLSSILHPRSSFFRTVAQLAVQVAGALEHAHGLGVVHRDVKPANLLLDARGNLWVTDFGLAQVQTDTRLTLTGDLVGTLRYMSPEQALAHPAGVDQRTDIYSLGATLYELLTLEPAFSGRDRQELLRQIAFEEPRRVRRVSTAVPTELETIVLKAMAKDPADRYATAQELADDLRRYLEDKPIRARRPSWLEQARKWARRHRPVVWSALVALLVTVVVLAGSVGWIVRDRAARQAKVARDLQAALEESRRFQREGKRPQAQAAAKRAEALLLDGAGEPELAVRVQGLLRELAEEEADVRLVARLEEIRLLQAEVNVKDDRFVRGTALPDYRRAFEDYGLRAEATAPEGAAGLLRCRPAVVRGTLVAALDHWLILARQTQAPEAGWLERVIATADTDPWRQRVRAARERNERQVLEKLAREPGVAAQPPEELFLLNLSLRQGGAKEAGVALLRRAQQAFPGDFWINHELGMALQACQPRQYQDAIPFLTAAVALRPESGWARHHLGLAFLATGRLDDAIEAFRTAIELKPDYATAHHDLGLALVRKGRLDAAIAAYRRAIRLNPKLAIAHLNLGFALTLRGRLDEAIAADRRAIDLMPKWAMGHDNLGLALWRKGRVDEAVAAFHHALGLDPNLATADFNLGNALTDQGRLDEAVAAYRRAIKLVPDWLMAHYNLGNVLCTDGRFAEAVAAYRRVIELRPDYAEAHCKLGSTLRRQGEFVQALAAFKRGHGLGSRRPDWRYPSAQWVRECQRLVELDGREQAVLRGETQPADAAERNECAQLCYYKRHYLAAARLWAAAFTADPRLADDLVTGHRDDAACAAALAAAGHSADARRLDGKGQLRWRQQALEWLRADLTVNARLLASRKPEDRRAVRQRLWRWRREQGLAGLRDPAAVAKLPANEREACKHFWEDVEALLAKAGAPE